MADDTRRLLDYIVRTYVLHDELVGIDSDAQASEHGAAIDSDKRQTIRREMERADEYADAFGRGLALAHDGLVVLDDRNADENRIADALIYGLVRHDLATSRTVETEPNHYRYRIVINRERMEATAKAAGVDLAQAIGRRDS